MFGPQLKHFYVTSSLELVQPTKYFPVERSFERWYTSHDSEWVVSNDKACLILGLVVDAPWNACSGGARNQLLAKYINEGKLEDQVQHLRGAFQVFQIDLLTGDIQVAIDPMGQFRLYYMKIGKELLFSSNLNLFASEKTSVNKDWASSYLNGNDNFCNATPLNEVNTLGPASLLKIESGDLTQSRYFDLPAYFKNKYFSKKSNKQDVYRSVASIVQSDIDQAAKSSAKLGLSFSQGVDSQALFYTLKNRRIDCQYFIRQYEGQAEELTMKLEEIRNFHPDVVFNEIPVPVDTALNGWAQYPYVEPSINSWTVPTINKTFLVDHAQRYGVDCLLNGNGGDELFLHRYRYWALLLLFFNRHLDDVARIAKHCKNESKEDIDTSKIIRTLSKIDPRFSDDSFYSFSPKELSPFIFDRFYKKYDGQIIDFIYGERHSAKGCSYERLDYLYSGVFSLAPFIDHKLCGEIWRMGDDDLLEAARTPQFYNYFKDDSQPTMYVSKRFNYSVPTRNFRMDADTLEALNESRRWTLEVGYENTGYFLPIIDRALEDQCANMEIARFISLYLWYQNRGKGIA